MHILIKNRGNENLPLTQDGKVSFWIAHFDRQKKLNNAR